MARDEKLELLAKIPLLAGLGRKDLARVGQLADEVELPAGRVLMRQGERGDQAFVIIEGSVRVERDGRVIAERGPSEILGEIALVHEGPRTATVTVTAPSRMLVIGHREFHALMNEIPEVRLQVLDTLAGRVRRLDRDAVN
jgi:CRP-like cAMP-binding protein